GEVHAGQAVGPEVGRNPGPVTADLRRAGTGPPDHRTQGARGHHLVMPPTATPSTPGHRGPRGVSLFRRHRPYPGVWVCAAVDSAVRSLRRLCSHRVGCAVTVRKRPKTPTHHTLTTATAHTRRRPHTHIGGRTIDTPQRRKGNHP